MYLARLRHRNARRERARAVDRRERGRHPGRSATACYGVIEYKKDCRDGKLKITEATGGRTFRLPHSLVTLSGINLPHIRYRDVPGPSVEKQTHFE